MRGKQYYDFNLSKNEPWSRSIAYFDPVTRQPSAVVSTAFEVHEGPSSDYPLVFRLDETGNADGSSGYDADDVRIKLFLPTAFTQTLQVGTYWYGLWGQPFNEDEPRELIYGRINVRTGLVARP